MEAAGDRWPEPEPNPPASAAAGEAEQLVQNKESLNGNRPSVSHTPAAGSLGDPDARTPSLGTAGSPPPQGASTLEESEARVPCLGTGGDSPADASDVHGTEAMAADCPGPPNGEAVADGGLGSQEFGEPAAGDAGRRDSQEPGENGLALGSSDTSDGAPGGRSPAPCNGSGADKVSTAVPHGHPDPVTDLIDTQDPAQANRQGAATEVDSDVPGVGESAALWGAVADLSAGPFDSPLPDVQAAGTHFADGQAAGTHFADGQELAADPDGLAHYQPAAGDYEAVESDDGVPPYPADFEKYWKIVEENPYDFTGWTYVLQYVEQENHIWAVRRAFDSFFTRYPYCYGYWKKYADIEKRLGFTKEAEEVYQRGLQSIPLSVDLWVHYITFLQEILEPTSPDTSVKLRSVFEMALAAAGTDFRSDRLWDQCVTWEKEQGNLKAVTAIYDRLLSIPTQLYSHHFEKFKEHVQSYSPKDILSTDEFLRLRSEVVTSLVAAEGDADEGPPGDDPPPGVGTSDQEKADTEMGRIRAHLEATRQEMYLLNEEEVSKRWHFEEAIKRPYFHVKPLERVQLKNWKDYLDFEIASGTNERVLVLFERCVIACALYEDFWIKYAKYLESHSVEAVRNVFQRACMVHLPKKPTLHLLWAAFEEQQGEFKEAQRILRSFQTVMPGLAMVLLRRVSLERRCGNVDEAEALLREAIEQHQDTPLASFFAVKLSRQLLKVQRNLAKARKVLLEAIDRDKDNVKLYLNLLELEFSCDVRTNESSILGCFDQALTGPLPPEVKIVFSQRRVEFLEDFGSSVRSLLQAYDEHQKLLKQNASKKRAAENGTEEPDEKRARAEDGTPAVTATSATALTSSDAVGSQAAYSYSAWYQPYASYGYQSPWNYNQYYPHS